MQVGITSILQSKKLWATDLRFVNDTSEGSYARDQIREYAKTQLRSALGIYRLFLDALVRRLETNTEGDIFSVSFCGGGDVLSQWRHYAKMSAGVAIGFYFPPSRFMPEIQSSGAIGLSTVSYDPILLSQGIDDLFQVARYWAQAIPIRGRYTRLQILTQRVAANLNMIIPTFKHPAFGEERESRAINYLPQSMPRKYRQVGDLQIPYIEMPIETPQFLYVREVIVAPGSAAKDRLREIKRLLRDLGYDHVKVKKSTIPYREIG